MIDWLTVHVPCRHDVPLFGGSVVSLDQRGNLEWAKLKMRQVVGSHDSSLRVSTGLEQRGQGYGVRIDGNPCKWLQGHNLFGSDDVLGLVRLTMERLVELVPELQPTPEDVADWWTGEGVFLSRVDLTRMYHLASRDEVKGWLRAMAEYSRLRHRGRGELKEGTLYFGKHSRRWALKCYSKGDELEAKGHGLAVGLDTPAMRDYADGALRLEVVIRSMELQERGWYNATDWPAGAALERHREFLEGLEVAAAVYLAPEVLEGLPPRLVGAYALWRTGADLRAVYPDRTWYRYRGELKKVGIDIAVPCPKAEQTPAPVPRLREVLEAVPLGVPSWAVGTPLYADPSVTEAQRPLQVIAGGM